jgi:hypothetical protein
MYVGEPHTDDYKGNVRIDELQLLIPATTTKHRVRVSSLPTPGAVYHYKVVSRDAQGNRTESGDYTFTTQSSGSGHVSDKNVGGGNIGGGNW